MSWIWEDVSKKRKFSFFFVLHDFYQIIFYVDKWHCAKCVRIRSYFGLHFPTLGLNTERYSVSLLIQSECGKMIPRDERYGVSFGIQSKCGKMRTRITPNTNVFHAVWHASLRLFFKTLLWIILQWFLTLNSNILELMKIINISL